VGHFRVRLTRVQPRLRSQHMGFVFSFAGRSLAGTYFRIKSAAWSRSSDSQNSQLGSNQLSGLLGQARAPRGRGRGTERMDLVRNEATTPLSRVPTHLSPPPYSLCRLHGMRLELNCCRTSSLARPALLAASQATVFAKSGLLCTWETVHSGDGAKGLPRRMRVSARQPATRLPRKPAFGTPSICSTCKARKTATTRDQGSMWCPHFVLENENSPSSCAPPCGEIHRSVEGTTNRLVKTVCHVRPSSPQVESAKFAWPRDGKTTSRYLVVVPSSAPASQSSARGALPCANRARGVPHSFCVGLELCIVHEARAVEQLQGDVVFRNRNIILASKTFGTLNRSLSDTACRGNRPSA
jgi:hypothetical protein